MTEVQAERMAALSDLALLPLESDTIAFSEAAQLLLSLNPSATLVVRELRRGAGASDVARVLAARGMVASEQATQWVEATLAALGSHGLLTNGPTSPASPGGAPDGAEAAEVRPYTPFRPVTEQHYRLLETRALIRFGAWAQARLVNSVLGHLATDEPGVPSIVIDLKAEPLEHHRMRSDVYRDRLPIARARGLSCLGPIVKATLWQSAIDAHDFLMYIHAGVVGTGDSCVLLPAAPGSGKSSLTAALVHRGFRYFSDEVALIEPATFHVPPMPLAMAIKSTGWDLMARYHPGIESLPIHVRNDAKVLRYVPPPAYAAGQTAAPVSHIIFPRYEKDAPTRLTPVPRAESLGRLMGECLGLRRRLDHDNVRQLVRWMAGIDCYALDFSCLEAAADLVVEATGYPPTGPFA